MKSILASGVLALLVAAPGFAHAAKVTMGCEFVMDEDSLMQPHDSESLMNLMREQLLTCINAYRAQRSGANPAAVQQSGASTNDPATSGVGTVPGGNTGNAGGRGGGGND